MFCFVFAVLFSYAFLVMFYNYLQQLGNDLSEPSGDGYLIAGAMVSFKVSHPKGQRFLILRLRFLLCSFGWLDETERNKTKRILMKISTVLGNLSHGLFYLLCCTALVLLIDQNRPYHNPLFHSCVQQNLSSSNWYVYRRVVSTSSSTLLLLWMVCKWSEVDLFGSHVLIA